MATAADATALITAARDNNGAVKINALVQSILSLPVMTRTSMAKLVSKQLNEPAKGLFDSAYVAASNPKETPVSTEGDGDNANSGAAGAEAGKVGTKIRKAWGVAAQGKVNRASIAQKTQNRSRGTVNAAFDPSSVDAVLDELRFEPGPDMLPGDDLPRARERNARAIAREKFFREERDKHAEAYPVHDYGTVTMRYPRGTAAGMSYFGATAATADDTQLAHRAMTGWRGHGAYMNQGDTFVTGERQFYLPSPLPHAGFSIGGTGYSGEGAFWSSLWDGIKSVGRAVLPVLAVGAQAALPALVKAGVDRLAPGSGAGDVVANIASSVVNPMLSKISGSGKYSTGDVFDNANAQYLADMTYGEETEFLAGFMRRLLSHEAGRAALVAAVSSYNGSGMGQISDINKQHNVPRIENVVKNKETPYGNTQFMMNNLVDPGAKHSRTNPQIATVQDETGDLVFSYREYVKDIKSTSLNFSTIEKFELNPGIAYSFPLLSSFAQYFEEYDFEQLIFHFKSLVTDGNATAAGSVMIVPIYNPSSNVLPDKRSCENTDQCVSGKVTSDLVCGVECDNTKKALGGYLYVRADDVPREQRRTFDLGFVQVALQGVPADMHIGELWVEYKVRLSKLRVTTNSSVPIGQGVTIAGNAPSMTGDWNGTIPVNTIPIANVFSDMISLNLTGSSQNLAKFTSSGSVAMIHPSITSVDIAYTDGAHANLGVTRVTSSMLVTTGQRYRITFSMQAKPGYYTDMTLSQIWDPSIVDKSFLPLRIVTGAGASFGTVPWRVSSQHHTTQTTGWNPPVPSPPPNNIFPITNHAPPTCRFTSIVEIEITQQQFQQTGSLTLAAEIAIDTTWLIQRSTMVVPAVEIIAMVGMAPASLSIVRIPY